MTERKSPGNKVVLLTLVLGMAIGLTLTLRFMGRQDSGTSTIESNGFHLDTLVSIRVYQSDRQEILDGAFELIEVLENQLSHYRISSEISRINSAPVGTAVTVSDSTRELIAIGLRYARLSDGAFDPTIGALVKLWGIGSEKARLPSPHEIQATLSLVDYRAVSITSETVTLERQSPAPTSSPARMTLDLGGIAKGWIADRVAEFLQNSGEHNFLINLGGNIVVSGSKPNGEAYKIGMQDPFGDRGKYLGIFTLEGGSVVSSGIYERFSELDGKRYHHILSTSNGYPIDNGLAGVTILSEHSVDGDALSTAIFALGIEEGLRLAQSLDGIEAALVDTDGNILITPGAAANFKPSVPDLQIEVR